MNNATLKDAMTHWLSDYAPKSGDLGKAATHLARHLNAGLWDPPAGKYWTGKTALVAWSATF